MWGQREVVRYRENVAQTKLCKQQSHCSDFKIVILVVYYPIAIRSLQAIYINERNREAPREQ